MRTMTMIVALGLVAAAAPPVLAASCRDEITALDARLKEEATAAISSTTSSKEVSLSREARAVESRNKDVPVTAVPTAPPAGTPEAKATERAEEAGGAGDRVMQAKALLNRAHTLAGRGDDAGCLATIALAKKQLEQ